MLGLGRFKVESRRIGVYFRMGIRVEETSDWWGKGWGELGFALGLDLGLQT